MTTLDALENKIDDLTKTVAHIETLVSTEAERCPYREDVAQVARNEESIKGLTKDVNSVQIKYASLGAMWGAIGGALTGLASKFFNFT